MHTYIHTWVGMYIYVCVHVFVYVSMFACMHVHKHYIQIQAYIHICVLKHIFTYHKYICTCTYIYYIYKMYIHIHAYLHMYVCIIYMLELLIQLIDIQGNIPIYICHISCHWLLQSPSIYNFANYNSLYHHMPVNKYECHIVHMSHCTGTVVYIYYRFILCIYAT